MLAKIVPYFGFCESCSVVWTVLPRLVPALLLVDRTGGVFPRLRLRKAVADRARPFLAVCPRCGVASAGRPPSVQAKQAEQAQREIANGLTGDYFATVNIGYVLPTSVPIELRSTTFDSKDVVSRYPQALVNANFGKRYGWLWPDGSITRNNG